MPNERFNAGLRIRIPKKNNIECSDAKMAKMKAKAPAGWEVIKNINSGDCYYYNPKNNSAEVFTPAVEECSGSFCAIQGGSKKTRRYRKTKTQKRRK